MSAICTNIETTNGTFTDVTDACVASWELTQDQLIISAIAMGGILVIACVWVSAAKLQMRTLKKGEVGFSRVARAWARTSRFAIWMNRPIQFLLSTAIFVTFSVRLTTYTVTATSYNILTALYCLSIIDDVIRFFASRYKIVYVLSPYVILETMCICSHFVLGYGRSRVIDGTNSRTWLDFSVLRPIFMYRSFCEMERHFPKSTKGWMMCRLWIKSLLLIIFAASVIFFIETLGELPYFEGSGFAHIFQCTEDGTLTRNPAEDCTDGSFDETWSISFAFYFTIVTLTTVGYGDIAPQTTLARFLVIIFIVAGIIKFSVEIENWISIYKLSSIGNPPYSPAHNSVHVVIIGNPTYVQLSGILRELTHEDHIMSGSSRSKLHAVVLGSTKSSYASWIIRKMKENPEFSRDVTYVAGDATNPADLDRALIKEASAAFFIPNKHAADRTSEDHQNILRVLSVKRRAGHDFRCLVILLAAENRRHVVSAGVHPDDIVCEDSVKMGVLAQSCDCPGYSTIISNMTTSLSIDSSSVQETKVSAFGALAERLKAKKAARLSYLLQEACPFHELIEQDKSGIAQSYFEGASREIYVTILSPSYLNLSFAAAALKAFKESNGAVVFMACEVSRGDYSATNNYQSFTNDSVSTRVLLNPGKHLRISSRMRVYMLADDFESVVEFGIASREHADQEAVVDIPDDSPQERLDDTQGYTATPAVDNFVTAFDSASTPRAGSSEDNIVNPPSDYGRPSSIQIDSPTANIIMRFQGQTSPMLHERAASYELIERDKLDAFDESYKTRLKAPPLEVLRNPNHIVVCSYLGSSALSSLEHFIAPLRGAYSTKHPPITILDESKQSHEWIQHLGRFKNIYHSRGSPLVYRELQRAGSKAAAAVIVLAKKSTSVSNASRDVSEHGNAIFDSEAIFTTMLVELDLRLNDIFCITELSDQKNSKFLGAQGRSALENKKMNILDKMQAERSFYNTALRTLPLGIQDQNTFLALPRYMAGRLCHPLMCENLLIQSFYNPNIHRIMRQLVGGYRSTGQIVMFNIPKCLRDKKPLTFGKVFEYFAESFSSGICIGVFRQPINAESAVESASLPIAITGPEPSLNLNPNDRLYILLGWHAVNRAARRIQTLAQKLRYKK